MTHLLKLSAWGLALGLACGNVFAQEDSIGFIKTVKGDAAVVTGEQSTPAVPGTALKKGQVLKTGSNASIGVTLKDNTLLSTGANTEFAVEDYQYAPGQERLSLLIRLTKGSLHYISGVIAKLKPENVSIKTPTSLIGVRGTEFVVHVDGGQP
jgi:hypothetical protein